VTATIDHLVYACPELDAAVAGDIVTRHRRTPGDGELSWRMTTYPHDGAVAVVPFLIDCTQIRREVLGEGHVDRSMAQATDQPHGCVPHRGAISSPARTVCTGVIP
jgi:hypothetical protein